MSEWVNARICKPPISHSVLLYVCLYYEDGVSFWDDNMFVGFYSDEMEDNESGYYIESMNEDGITRNMKLLVETKQTKVLAWTLLPRAPYNEKFNRKEDWSW